MISKWGQGRQKMCQLIKLLTENHSLIDSVHSTHIRRMLTMARLCSRCSVWDYGNEMWQYYGKDLRLMT